MQEPEAFKCPDPEIRTKLDQLVTQGRASHKMQQEILAEQKKTNGRISDLEVDKAVSTAVELALAEKEDRGKRDQFRYMLIGVPVVTVAGLKAIEAIVKGLGG